jgi:hypothetical protein
MGHDPASVRVRQTMRILVAGKGSRVYGPDDMAAAMQSHGHELIAVSERSGALRGDVLVLLGFENWYLHAPLELLHRARAAGIPRVLWQFEPLLPPGLPAVTRPFVTRGNETSGRAPAPDSGMFSRVAHGLQVARLLIAARRENWGSSIFSPHVFKYPIGQSRGVAASWDQGLFDHIVVSLRPRAAFLRELGIPSTFLPIGYTPTLGRSLGNGDRDIDVLFFGHVSSRRRALLKKIDTALRRAGYALKIIERDCYGEDRTAILNRSKIVLNLHKFPWEFAGQRLLMAMSCRALVVSEGAPDTAPYEHGKHMFTARIEELPDVLVTLLRDQGTRETVAEAGYRFATSEMRLEHVLSAALGTIVHQPA